MVGLFEYMCIDKWGEPKKFYLLTHQHADHLRKATALSGEVSLIVSEDRDARYGIHQGDPLAEYYEYLSTAVDFRKVTVCTGEVLNMGNLCIEVIRTDLHSDFFLVRYSGGTALVCGDLNTNQIESFIEEAMRRDVSEVYIPVYARHAEHLADPSEKGVGREIYRLGWQFKSRRYFLRPPRVIAMGHSDGAKKPPWADDFIPPIPAEQTFAL